MAQMCKKHGKPRDVIYEKKMPRGGMFSIVGCRDCAAGAAEAKGVTLTKPKKGPAARAKARSYEKRREWLAMMRRKSPA